MGRKLNYIPIPAQTKLVFLSIFTGSRLIFVGPDSRLIFAGPDAMLILCLCVSVCAR